jgi:hypothetical protein
MPVCEQLLVGNSYSRPAVAILASGRTKLFELVGLS